MRTQSHISAIALAAALIAVPQAAQAQLNLGVNLGGKSSGGLGAGVNVGIGGTNVGVNAGVGGGSLVDANVGIGSGSGSGSSSGSGGSSNVLDPSILDIDLGVGTQDELLDVDADILGEDGVGADVVVAPSGSGGTAPATEPLIGVRISALEETARLDAVVDLINQPDLGDLDLDEIIDDQQVSIVAASDILGSDNLAEIDAAIEAGGTGRDELLAAIDASVELGSILGREGVDTDDVVALYVGAGGETEVLVVDAAVDLAGADGAGDELVATDLADVDIDLLSEDELAEIDIAALPNEEQRLDAIIRLLGTGGGTPSGGTVGSVDIINLDTLLGDEALAEVDAVLGENQDDLVLSADLLDALDQEGLSPEAVVAVRNDAEGNTQLFVDLGLGETAAGEETPVTGGDLLDQDLADLDIDLLSDDELAQIDLALLPNEEQRLDAIIRILGTDGDAGNATGTGPIEVIDVDALLGEESLAELDLVLNGEDSPTNSNDLVLSADLLDALEDQGLSPEAVIGIGTTPEGATQVLVNAGLDGTALADAEMEIGGGAAGSAVGGVVDAVGEAADDLADVDIDLLTDDELAEIDLALLPDEEQRLDAIIRILGIDGDSATDGAGTGTGPIEIIDVDALLGQDSLAELDLVLDGEDSATNSNDVVLSADLLDALGDQGLSPDAVIGIGTTPDGATQVFVNAGRGNTQVADVTLDIGGTGGAGGGTGTGGTGTGGSGGTGTGTGGTGTGTGGTGGDGTGGTGGSGTGGTGDGGTGGTGTGGTGNGGTGNGSGATDDGDGNEGSDGSGSGGGTGSTGGLVAENGALTGSLPSALVAVDTVIADVSCEAGIATLSTGQPVEPADVSSVRTVELVRLEGCVQTLNQEQIQALRAAIEQSPTLLEGIEGAGLSLDTLVGGNIEGSSLTLYFEDEAASA